MAVKMKKIKSWLRLAQRPELAPVRAYAREAVRQSLDRRLRVAVTGLSTSGKSTFITSLVRLLTEARETDALPFFSPQNHRQILGVRVSPLREEAIPMFPYAESVQRLSQTPPRWPVPTRGLSGLQLEILYRHRGGLKRLLKEKSTLYLEIIDYPGEWLLDLPLLEQDFLTWSATSAALFDTEPRAGEAQAWRRRLQEVDLRGPADPAWVNQLSREYRELLKRLREQHGLSFLQPGGLLAEAGTLADDELFFPWLEEAGEGKLPKGSLGHALSRRYERYRRRHLETFYRQHFSRFDRQIILVDCLQTLNRGPACFEDMQHALTEVLKSFDYGASGFLRRIFKPRIDKVLFAATKADHVTANQHPNLDRFLNLMLRQSRERIAFEGLETRTLAISSLRSTEPAEVLVDGQHLSCLKGFRKGSHEAVALFPGEVPTELPDPSDWNASRFRFIDFAPVSPDSPDAWRRSHIRLDQALDFVIGDKLR